MAPVGCYESLHAAINAGANSIYFGIGRLNMRSASAANFSETDMEQIVEIAHKAGVKTLPLLNPYWKPAGERPLWRKWRKTCSVSRHILPGPEWFTTGIRVSYTPPTPPT